MTNPSAATKPTSEPQVGPGSGLRTTITLLLFMHLCCIFAALSSNCLPSRLQLELLAKLRFYAQLLNFDLTEPYYLTLGRPVDGDHRIEVLPAGQDAADPAAWLALPDVGWRGGERRLRYERLGKLIDISVDQGREDRVPQLVSSVGSYYLNHRQIKPQQIRCRRHVPVPLDAYLDPDLNLPRDPDDPSYFGEVYAANAVVDEETGLVEVVKIEAVGQAAGSTGSP